MKSGQLVWSQFCVELCLMMVLLKDVSTGQSKFINKEISRIIVYEHYVTDDVIISLTVSWLLVILNHLKNFERFSCTGFRIQSL